MIDKVLSAAIQLWLKTQVQEIEALEVKIVGKDRQIFQGYIPEVCLFSSYAIYQGIHVDLVELKAENIRINLGQILKGKPLKILEPIIVAGNLVLEERNLQISLSSALLNSAFDDLIIALLENNGIDNPRNFFPTNGFSWQEIYIQLGEFTLKGKGIDLDTCVILQVKLQLLDKNTLYLEPLEIQISPQLTGIDLKPFSVDLGNDVALETLSLESGKVVCRGSATVFP